MTFIPLLQKRQKVVAAAAADVNFVRIHVNRGSAGNGIVDIEHDGEVPGGVGESGFTLEIASSVGDDTSYTTIADTLYTVSKVDTNYVRFTISGNSVNDIQASHNLRISHDGTQTGIATYTNQTTMTNSSSVDLLDGLVAVWLGNESSGNMADSLSTHDATNNNTTPFVSALNGNGPDFTGGSSHYFNVGDHADFDGGAYNMHIGLRVKFDGTGSDETCISRWNGGPNSLWNLRKNTSDQMTVRFIASDNSAHDATNTTARSAGTWYTIQTWWDDDGEEIGIKVDADADVTTSFTGKDSKDLSIDTNIGRRGDGADYLTGVLDGIHIWNKRTNALSAAEKTSFDTGDNDYPFKPKA